jgi:hypothetical protein
MHQMCHKEPSKVCGIPGNPLKIIQGFLIFMKHSEVSKTFFAKSVLGVSAAW